MVRSSLPVVARTAASRPQHPLRRPRKLSRQPWPPLPAQLVHWMRDCTTRWNYGGGVEMTRPPSSRGGASRRAPRARSAPRATTRQCSWRLASWAGCTSAATAAGAKGLAPPLACRPSACPRDVPRAGGALSVAAPGTAGTHACLARRATNAKSAAENTVRVSSRRASVQRACPCLTHDDCCYCIAIRKPIRIIDLDGLMRDGPLMRVEAY
mmetsp:Transcript_14005/g.42383  ORF Transcript_14005/g.42383 Transcript_14005/m.42383 type:complete len:211 (-) Transcript_14005:33-665(-)